MILKDKYETEFNIGKAFLNKSDEELEKALKGEFNRRAKIVKKLSHNIFNLKVWGEYKGTHPYYSFFGLIKSAKSDIMKIWKLNFWCWFYGIKF